MKAPAVIPYNFLPDLPEKWDLNQAIDLVKKIEQIAPQCGCHVALTGGCLYKEGKRKDLDILFYRIRQVDEIDQDKLFYLLENELNMTPPNGFGWCYKSSYENKNIDIFFPEEQGGESMYPRRG